ncbi:MAG: hypothetical protein IT423_02720, partial [Pirellulaceae bacterium]|nr:hypothetical protein [Pirellulaceae bacterium]
MPATAPVAQGGATQGLRLNGVTLAPWSRPRYGKPIIMHAIIGNDETVPQSGIVVAKVNEVPDLQAAVHVHVPPKTVRVVELRLRVPPTLPTKDTLEMSVSLCDYNNPERVLLGPAGTPLLDSLRVSISPDTIVTALVIDKEPPILPQWAWPDTFHQMSYELVIAARVDTENSRRTLTIDHETLPSQLVDWEGMDTIVIGNDRPFQDVAVIRSMNRWLASGGRAWVMLDLITAANLRKILPDGTSCEAIDDMDMNRFVAESVLLSQLSEGDRTVVSEDPIRLRRVNQHGGEVTHRINGFPAAIWYRVGKGQILVTTLGAAGWLRPRETQRRPDVNFQSNFQMHTWAQPIADRLHDVNIDQIPIDKADIQYPLKHIGNPVLDRSFVLSMVFGFCGLLAFSGVVCWLRGQMIYLGWLIPLLSLAATIPLLVASAQLRREIPNTSAHLQLVEVLPGSEMVQATQWTATYMSGTDKAKLQAAGDAQVSWPHSDKQLDLRRWTWVDYGRWELSSSGWPNGLWRLQSKFGLPPRQLDVPARIDEKGLSFELPADLGQPLEDAVVQFHPGDPQPCSLVEQGKTVRVNDKHLTLIDTWMGSTIVDDEQARRDEVYRQLQAVESDIGYPSYPALLGWTKLWPGPIAWDQSRDERGSALVVLPIKLAPVASGTRVLVPHTVIRSETSSRSGSFSTAFSNDSGWWRQETTLPATVPIRFHLPRQVCPLVASEIICDLQLRAPQRIVTLYALAAGGQRIAIQAMPSPLGATRIRISDAALLSEARDGVLDFVLEIGQQGGPNAVDVTNQV